MDGVARSRGTIKPFQVGTKGKTLAAVQNFGAAAQISGVARSARARTIGAERRILFGTGAQFRVLVLIFQHEMAGRAVKL